MLFLTCFYYVLDTYIYIQLNMVKKVETVPLDASIHWHYLHQDVRKTYSEISKFRSYWKYSKTTIRRHMKRNI